jgi:hypothetical protein
MAIPETAVKGLAELPDADRGELEVTVEKQACFSADALRIVLAWGPAHATLTVGAGQPRPLGRTEVLAMARRLVAAATRAEVPPPPGSTTTHYVARLSWPGGEARFAASELSRRSTVEDMLRGRSDLLARVPEDLYAPAIGLYDAAQAIARS